MDNFGGRLPYDLLGAANASIQRTFGQFVMDVICLQETEFRSAMRGHAISECVARLQDFPATAADAE
jgi:hypothetical protein